MVGVWLDDDDKQNEIEIANAIEIAQARARRHSRRWQRSVVAWRPY